MNGISKSILAPTMEAMKEAQKMTVRDYAESEFGESYWFQCDWGRKVVQIVGFDSANMDEPYDSGCHFAIEVEVPYSSHIHTITHKRFSRMIEVSIEELTPVE